LIPAVKEMLTGEAEVLGYIAIRSWKLHGDDTIALADRADGSYGLGTIKKGRELLSTMQSESREAEPLLRREQNLRKNPWRVITHKSKLNPNHWTH
jgi:hypothetical protein